MYEALYNFAASLVGHNSWADVIAVAIFSAVPLLFVLIYGLLAILGEMKVSAWMQDRLGPMRTGPKGMLQPFADILKLLQKEDTTPRAADSLLFNLAPFVLFLGSYAAFAVLPFTAAYVGASINAGIFYLLAVGSLAVIGILLAGWGSNNKYSMLGAMRSVAQIVSYEIPAGLAILAVVMVAGTMDLQTLTELQSGGITNWFIFGGPKELQGFGGGASWYLMPLMIVAFVIYLLSSLAETNRQPFDLAEAESELVAGYHTEYSGMKFALFFLAEYANMFAVSAIAAILFFGGWQSPIPGFANGAVLGFLWFVLKGLSFVFLQILIRWTLPRIRVDQLMYLSWRVLIPFGIATIVGVGILVVQFAH